MCAVSSPWDFQSLLGRVPISWQCEALPGLPGWSTSIDAQVRFLSKLVILKKKFKLRVNHHWLPEMYLSSGKINKNCLSMWDFHKVMRHLTELHLRNQWKCHSHTYVFAGTGAHISNCLLWPCEAFHCSAVLLLTRGSSPKRSRDVSILPCCISSCEENHIMTSDLLHKHIELSRCIFSVAIVKDQYFDCLVIEMIVILPFNY